MRLSLKNGLMIPSLLVVTGLVIAILMFNSSAKDLTKVNLTTPSSLP
ncbi:MAG: hypothetical protein R2727_08190 [Bacteroidales bacterium]